jgi:hypothetical protein
MAFNPSLNVIVFKMINPDAPLITPSGYDLLGRKVNKEVYHPEQRTKERVREEGSEVPREE